MLLVAYRGEVYAAVCEVLLYLFSKMPVDALAVNDGPSPATSCSTSPLVSHFPRFNHWSSFVGWQHSHSLGSGPLQQEGPFCAPAQASLSQGNGPVVVASPL